MTLQALAVPLIAGRAARLPQAIRAATGDRVFAGREREDGDPRGVWDVLQRSGAERMGDGISGR